MKTNARSDEVFDGQQCPRRSPSPAHREEGFGDEGPPFRGGAKRITHPQIGLRPDTVFGGRERGFLVV
jgi:hypothetical protein